MCLRWLYATFLAIDANFRLKRRNVSSDEADPSLSTGWSYFVEETEYKSYLAKHLGEVQEVRNPNLLSSMFLSPFHRKAPAPVTMRSIWPTLNCRKDWLPLALEQ
jgi:hypothetical protein